MKVLLKACFTTLLLLAPLLSQAAPEKEYWPFWEQSNEANQKTLDHSLWQGLLDQYVRFAEKRDMYLFLYGGVSDESKGVLRQYLKEMSQLDPRKFARNEQLAYWINLYNALTVELILKNYPVKSITRLGKGWFRTGPWKDKVITVQGHDLSLDDIEHRIIRPIWNNPRIHFAVNCASVGCPDLAPYVYKGGNIEEQLEEAARRFINQTKGINFIGGRLVLSKIFSWYAGDFGGVKGVKLELMKLAEPDLKRRLSIYRGGISYQYDWQLNEFRR